jgi:hypothetical protein
VITSRDIDALGQLKLLRKALGDNTYDHRTQRLWRPIFVTRRTAHYSPG